MKKCDELDMFIAKWSLLKLHNVIFLSLVIKRLFFKWWSIKYFYWNNNEVVYDKNNKEVDESTFVN